MAVIKPISTSMSMVLSLGQPGGEDVTKTVSVSSIDVGATADALLNSANALATMLAHPMVAVRHYARGIVTE